MCIQTGTASCSESPSLLQLDLPFHFFGKLCPPLNMKHCCEKCHFLASGVNMVLGPPQSWNDELRERLKPLEGKGYSRRSTSGCYKGIWRDTFLPKGDNDMISIELFREEVQKDRKESCFFVKYQKGMTFEAAEELQRLEYDTRHLRRGYRHTQISLIVATVGLLLGAIFQLFQLLLNPHVSEFIEILK